MTAPVESNTPDVLVAALSKLRQCRDSIGVLRLTDEPPEMIFPISYGGFAQARHTATLHWTAGYVLW